jgi:hypothetical protein
MMVSGSGVRQVSGFLLVGLGGFRRAVFEAEAVVAGLEDVAAMSEAVEQRRRHFWIADQHMMPRLLTGWSLKFGLFLDAMGCSARSFPLSA